MADRYPSLEYLINKKSLPYSAPSINSHELCLMAAIQAIQFYYLLVSTYYHIIAFYLATKVDKINFIAK